LPSPNQVERAPAVDDAALIRGARAGRREDFETLVERYQKPLYGFIYRLVHDHAQAADIVQMTFLHAYTHLGQFAGRASFKTWLHQIALNESRAAHRRSRRHVSLDEMSEARVHQARVDAGHGSGVDPAAADGGPGGSGWRPVLERLVAQLPFRQRTVVTLRIFSDLPFRDIAEATGSTENAAKVNYHHAITRLRAWLREADR
jgi:RNA polymerase sigma-70 factor, ECF subfamily